MPGSDDLTNDRFGYSCYTFVFPAPDDIRQKVDAIERASDMTRAKIPAHITVKGTFHEVPDLDEVRNRAMHFVSRSPRFWLPFDGAEVIYRGSSAMLSLIPTLEMEQLHSALVGALRDIVTTVYTDDPYRAHMTLYQEATEDGIETAAALIEETDFGSGFEVTGVDLWGRIGSAHGGRWERIVTFPMA